MKNLFVGNLSYNSTEQGLRDLFAQYGEVAQVKIITDRDTGKPRGFAFVEMSQDEDADRAIAALNGKSYDGRSITVNEARPKPERGGGGYGGGRQGGGGGKRKGGGGGYDSYSREPRW